MKRIALIYALTPFLALQVIAQQIHYSVSFANAAHHEAKIIVQVTGAKTPVLNFRMSRSSPGRYATHEFGKNVYDVQATDGKNPLPLQRTDGDIYQVSGNKGTVIVQYTLFGNHADGTYAGIDAESIHLNMPASLMWVKGLEQAPITIKFEVPDPAFTIATQLKPAAEKNVFTAPGLQYLMDSPVKIGKLHWRTWQVQTPGGEMKIRLALEAEASDSQVDSLTDMVKRITTQAQAVFKEFPAYDYGTYTFISSINPYVYGDGMEHRNSTMITLPFQFTLAPDAIDVFAHEFFHCWNVERIRPKTLEPFNFEKSNMSNELWFAEGFTQYYGALLMVRAGLVEEQDFVQTIGRLVNTKLNAPGATGYSPIQSSNMAVFTDAGIAIDQTNYPNIFTSYYFYGASLALALDLELRSRFNKSLDLFMQQVWLNHGKKEIPYTVADLQKALAQVTNTAYAADFFKKYIYGHESPDYKPLLAAAGIELKKNPAVTPWIGNVGFTDNHGAQLNGVTLRNWPIYKAGLDAGDIITKINNTPIRTGGDCIALLSAKRSGEKLTVEYTHRGQPHTTELAVMENPGILAVLNRDVSDRQLNFRANWLGGRK